MSNIRDIIKELLKDNEEFYSLIATVSEVNIDKRVCKVQPVNGDAAIFNVRLQSKVSSEIGLILFPVEGSEVTVTFLSKELAFISQTSEIENIKLNIGDFSLFIDAENFNKSVKNIEINTESYEKNAVNTKINTENYELSGENAKFTLSSIFEVISSADIKLKALTLLLEATTINIKGITNITGATTINGAATITGAVAMTGAVSMGGGSNGGIPKGGALTTEINKIVTEVNKIRTALVGWTPVNNDGGAALKTRVSVLTNLSNVAVNNISNSNAVH
jgi:hypothetical protein